MTDVRPLDGTRIVVTRARAQAGPLTERLRTLGAEVVELPVIEIFDPATFDELDAALLRLAQGIYDWVIVASIAAAERLVDRLRALGIAYGELQNVKLAAVGPKTAVALERGGMKADLVPERFSAGGLVEALGSKPGAALWPRALDAPPGSVDALEKRGWRVEEVTAYENRLPVEMPAELDEVRAGNYDVVTFTSASTVRNFVALAGKPQKPVVCIGPSTAAQARALGVQVDAVAGEHTSEGLVAALLGMGGFKS